MKNTGKTVKVHYIGTLDDGTTFDSSYDHGEPLEFVCDTGMMVPAFDKAVAEMEVGETRKIHIPCGEAYGYHDMAKVKKVPTCQIPNYENLPIGQYITVKNVGGWERLRVISIENDIVTFDGNHELAGNDINFEITLLEVGE